MWAHVQQVTDTISLVRVVAARDHECMNKSGYMLINGSGLGD